MSSYVPPPYTPIKLTEHAYPCIYDWRKGSDDHHPDWEFFSSVSMTEPLFLKRVEEFVLPYSITPSHTPGKPPFKAYHFNVGKRFWLINLVIDRYLASGPLLLDEYQTLQKLARILSVGITECLADIGPNDTKNYLDKLLEAIRIIHVDWIQ